MVAIFCQQLAILLGLIYIPVQPESKESMRADLTLSVRVISTKLS
jgi:hypothetical protein